MFNEDIRESILESISVKEKMLKNEELLSTISKVSEEIINAFKNDKKVLICGNGGSAADAQHIAAELSGRFYFDREPLFAEALHVNTSYITAVANDYSYDEVYARLVKAKGRKGDILIGISTSVNSKNILKAIEIANDIGVITIGMTGESGGKMKEICRYLINVPSRDTPRIQEAHITIGHIICEIVERELFNG
ncbi:D-sedoheptulose 7-phosphate isomerase [Venenivibrio stagnispumantis]|uniref:Phosphoheptose isomerase n=1 Tax=Venenivibrio stagnispumantis TaxID=407998 RepID=A0AA45WN51_9AQUI|nr:D-sedoheptulose 7-phosphate isomerase [Venenivibrio stagnispumantis]MCW4573214.1 D-sedoheptulose 7-phosphate isomerase [Venenivibrio stagnispumantis]SMP17260.1 phosphoheptose isomerase [Venenivibrio stagnispumantis]